MKQISFAGNYVAVAGLCLSAIPLLVVHDLKWAGWLLLGLTVLFLGCSYKTRFSQHMLILAAMLALLGIVPINTGISYGHMVLMGSILSLVILIPYVITTYSLKERIITFPLRVGRAWYRHEIAYVLFAGAVAYLMLPFYLAHTGSYLNWTVQIDASHILRLFIGTNALGIWDEVFFVGVCLALLRSHLPFVWANAAQAALWTTFLYELGFRGWGPPLIYIFALLQGNIFRRTNSLLYIVTIHLAIDFVLFLTLIHLNHPQDLRIFITSPF